MKLQPRTDIEQRDGGFWWPSSVKQAGLRYWHHAGEMAASLQFVKTKGIAVQAGGHVGMFPLWLSQHFELVYTFEPEPRNFACLVRNANADNIIAQRGVLSDNTGTIELRVAGSGGGHNVMSEGGADKRGAIPSHVIDNLFLPRCDFIMLDIEGHEMPALLGAINTIDRCRPVITLEARGHGVKKGRGHTDEDVEHFILSLNYKRAGICRNDVIYTPREQ